MLQRLGGEEQDRVSSRTLRCPRCGLSLEVSSCGGQSKISYDFSAWDRLCGTPMLGGPSICLMLQNAPVERVASGH